MVRHAALRYFLLSFIGLILLDLCVVRSGSHLQKNFFGVRFLVNYGVGLLIVASGMWLVRFIFKRFQKTVFVIIIFFIAVAIAQLNHFAIYQEFISPFGFGFLFNNASLTSEYFFDNLRVARTILCFFGGFVCAFWFVKFVRVPVTLTSKRRLLLTSSLAVVCGSLTAVGTFAWYGVRDFQHFIPAFVIAFAENVSRKTGVFSVDRPKVPPSVANKNNGRVPSVVYVIGESATLSHFSLYGYSRKTTPNLEQFAAQKKLVAFRNAISVGHRTMLSVPYMLFGLAGPDPEGRIYKSPNLFNYAKARGLQTALISAQDLRWYNLDKLIVDDSVDVYKSGSSFVSNVTVSVGADDIQVLEDGVEPFLASASQPFFLVVQMNGSHYPYATHSPAAVKKFLPEDDPNSVNAYDNTIVYLDLYLKRLVDAVRQKAPQAWIFYSTDHGQNVDSEKKFNSDFNTEIIHNPLLVFPPDAEYDRLVAQQASPVSQADIAATILELIAMRPILPIDGVTLRAPIPANRLRVSSAFMPTFENEPSGALVFPNLEIWQVDFFKHFLRKPDASTIGFDELPLPLRQALKL